MNALIMELFDALGLEPDDEDTVLFVDDDLQIYFFELENEIEISSPLMVLPDNTEMLQKVLRMNYASPVVLAADADNTSLLAVQRISKDYSCEQLLFGVEQFIDHVKYVLHELI